MAKRDPTKPKKEIMSIAIDPLLEEEAWHRAKHKGMSRSAYVSELIEQAVRLGFDQDPIVVGASSDFKTIVLKVPAKLAHHPARLKEWLDLHMQKIIEKLQEES